MPKESTALLKEWLLSHMMLPYPGNEEKLALCKATNLDISQINNWFINARVRIWKPLVREVFDKYSERLLEQAHVNIILFVHMLLQFEVDMLTRFLACI